jgi:hypothetical protein
MKSKDLLSLTRNTSPDDLTSSTSRQTGCRCMFRRAICGGALLRSGSAALPNFSVRIVQSFGSISLAAPGRNLRRADSQVSQRGRVERDHIRPFGLTGNDGLVGDSFVCIARTGSGYLAAFQVTLSREDDTTPHTSPRSIPPQNPVAVPPPVVPYRFPCLSKIKIAIRIPAVAVCFCETK